MSTPKVSNDLVRFKVQAEDLRLGMYVAELDIPWLDSPFRMQGFVIKSEKELRKIQQICRYVYVEQERGKPLAYNGTKLRTSLWRRLTRYLLPSKKTAPRKDRTLYPPFSEKWLSERKPPQKTSTFAQEFAHAQTLHEEAHLVIENIIKDISDGKTIDPKLAKEVINDCVQSILRVPDTFMLLTQIVDRDNRTARHSLNVCIYALAFGRYMHLPREQLLELGLSGMLHDMGKIIVPLEVLNNPGKLTPEEMDIMRKHTTWGRQLLMESPGMPRSVIDVAHSHHERCDGKGYPRGLHEAQISPFARIIAIADTYDDITCDSVYRTGSSHLEALKLLIDESNGQLDRHLVVKFIESLGIYPAGCLVLLDSGEIGIVTETNPQHRLRPKIVVLLDKNQQPCTERPIDLSIEPHYGTIRSVVKPDTYGIDVNSYRLKGAFAV